MKYQFIAAHQREYPVKTMCRILEVAVSGYFAWLRRRARPAAAARRMRGWGSVLCASIRPTARSMAVRAFTPVLRAEGEHCGRKRVARLMREHGLSAKPRTHRVRTTDSQHEHPVAPNLLNRDFTATAPNTKWVADITGVWTWEGWLYLAVVLDIFSRMVVGWAMESHRDEALVEQAALMALARRHPEPGLLHHSDRGSQYTCRLPGTLAHCGIVVSMSRKADCYDNALMESFIGTLKSECVDRESYQTREEARHSIFEYLEVFYNRQRLHSSLGYVSPVMYEQQVK